jgi:alkyl sulfatase BDS1-like metallo-beta-lactamase superfamily hydrolase
MVVFRSDKRLANNHEDNILRYFNSTISDLTKIPDYIIFIENSNIVDVIIVEMKSERHDNNEVKIKFRNGKIIANYLIAITNKQLNSVKLLLSLKPSKKSTMNSKNQEKFLPDKHYGWYTIKSKRFNALDLLALQP